MDMTTLVGFGAVVAIAWLAMLGGGVPAAFLNWHGVVIVIGGVGSAMLINTPMRYILQAIGSMRLVIGGGRYQNMRATISAVVALAEQVQARGTSAFQDADASAAGGFLNHAAQAAIEYNNADLVDQILTNEIDQAFDHQNEVVNVFRTMGVLAPMFGLVGTLVGIVEVLRQIANPEQVGTAMAVALTTAFYGILLANIFCVPVAGKLRIRFWEELQAKTIIKEGVVMMMRGTVPLIIERKLQSYH
jgi:chemotaxis protein MotA